ncbi:recombinase family protein [uncultured Roseobacter sp.]|uniref:recombinase family protein n=1 Tax=uncultured Roseobacter sp. TaxID=114847 RepID=UPI00261F3299|nr:recombinase family protein [uncultured Roseobacter sp.]
MKSCFGYIRVSTQKQGEGVSLEAQKEAITDFASRNALTITKWFEEKQTAAKSGRPIFNQMLRQLKQGRAQGLIMHKIDRSARNLRDWALVSELPKHGVKPYFAVDGIDMETRGGRLSANLQAVIAEDYIHNLREECIKGLRGRLKQGLYPFQAPIGYLDNGRGKPKTPCPEKAPLIKMAFDLYLSGVHSINSLQQEMALRGLTNHLGKPVSKHGIETILRNPFYTGLIRIERTNETFAGIHEPIVSTRQFERVQEIKAGRAGKKVTRHNHLYRGLFKCGGCGRSMIPERQKGHVYYRCQTKECPKNTIREDRLEDAILAAYQRLAMKPKDVERNAKEWLKWLQGSERRELAKSIELRVAKSEERHQNLIDLLIDGAIDRHTYDDRKQRLALEIASLREELAEQKSSDLSRDNLLKFLELISSLASLHASLDHDEKRLMLRNCFSNLCVKASEPVLEPCSWLLSRDFGELSPLVTQLGPLLELLEDSGISRHGEQSTSKVPQWKHNLKNHNPDELD